MGIRETLNQNPAITTGATAGIIVLALGFILYQSFGSSGPSIPTKSFFTTDDGATYFADDIKLVPPFEKDGKQAVQAFVYTCDGGKTKFVAYLQRYTPEAKKIVESVRGANANDPAAIGKLEEAQITGIEVKKPGDKDWVNQRQMEKFMQVQSIQCPTGSIENLEPVMP